ncbi:MAG: hypothetical protein AUF76_08680 [Acidobacteria bacterium 13_1_20CM_2_65_9]|nr:MAG: hypothetical protein AUF76_08680 [Acidobacteria bacterium 13_1_20CM_2_65_9]
MIRAEPTEMDGGNGFTNGGTEQTEDERRLLTLPTRRNEKETPIGLTPGPAKQAQAHGGTRPYASRIEPSARLAYGRVSPCDPALRAGRRTRGAPFLRSSMFVLFSVSAEYLAETTKNES